MSLKRKNSASWWLWEQEGGLRASHRHTRSSDLLWAAPGVHRPPSRHTPWRAGWRFDSEPSSRWVKLSLWNGSVNPPGPKPLEGRQGLCLIHRRIPTTNKCLALNGCSVTACQLRERMCAWVDTRADAWRVRECTICLLRGSLTVSSPRSLPNLLRAVAFRHLCLWLSRACTLICF